MDNPFSTCAAYLFPQIPSAHLRVHLELHHYRVSINTAANMAPLRNENPHSGADPVPPPDPPGPHPSFIQVAKPYLFEQTIQECLTATGVSQLREDNIRLQGVTWIDNVRKALHLYGPLS